MDGALSPMAVASVGTGTVPVVRHRGSVWKVCLCLKSIESCCLAVHDWCHRRAHANAYLVSAPVPGPRPMSSAWTRLAKYACVANGGTNHDLAVRDWRRRRFSPNAGSQCGRWHPPETITVDATGKYAYVTNWAEVTLSRSTSSMPATRSPRWQRRPSAREFDPLQLQPGTRPRTDSHD